MSRSQKSNPAYVYVSVVVDGEMFELAISGAGLRAAVEEMNGGDDKGNEITQMGTLLATSMRRSSLDDPKRRGAEFQTITGTIDRREQPFS